MLLSPPAYVFTRNPSGKIEWNRYGIMCCHREVHGNLNGGLEILSNTVHDARLSLSYTILYFRVLPVSSAIWGGGRGWSPCLKPCKVAHFHFFWVSLDQYWSSGRSCFFHWKPNALNGIKQWTNLQCVYAKTKERIWSRIQPCFKREYEVYWLRWGVYET